MYLGKRYFTLKLLIFRKFLLWHLSQILKYSLHKSPRGPPNFRSEKYGISAFTGKKINVVTILDQNLVRFEICNEKSIFQIFTWYSWKSRFSTIYKLEILKTVKRLSRTAMTLIFCFRESWNSILFKNLKGMPKEGPGKEIFWLKSMERAKRGATWWYSYQAPIN